MNFSEFFFKDLALHNTGERKYLTDKGDTHYYIKGYYSDEFSPLRDASISLLEIGLAYCGSAKLWRDWFVNGNIDIIEYDKSLIKDVEGVNIFCANAYTESTLNGFKDDHYDYIIDDGPHTIESQMYAVQKWISKVKPGGKLIIEDISSDDHLAKLISLTSFPYKVFDFRKINGRFDDLILEITKS